MVQLNEWMNEKHIDVVDVHSLFEKLTELKAKNKKILDIKLLALYSQGTYLLLCYAQQGVGCPQFLPVCTKRSA